jgi:hypothetical protein
MTRLSEMDPVLRRRIIVEAQNPPCGMTPGQFLEWLEDPSLSKYEELVQSAISTFEWLDDLDGLDEADSPEEIRRDVVARLGAGEISTTVATGALIGEGFDCPALSALFLATPLSYEGRLIQYLGRVGRSAPGKSDAVVYDYVDAHPMLYSSFGKRNRVYRRQREHVA